jgi:hypothetical protein
MVGQALAFSITLAGVFCLYGSWRRLSFFYPVARYIGWLLLLVACIAWIVSSNIELGISYAMLAITVCAWLLVILNYELRTGKQKDLIETELVLPRGATLLRHASMFLLAILLAGITAACLSTAFISMLPWQLGNALVLAMLLMPVLWGAGAWWALADPQLARPGIGMGVLLVISLLILYT